jgi:disease resistance protein RPM1
MELAVGASEATLKSLLSKLGSLLAEEYALIRGVRGEIQFITDELASMQAFLSNLSKSEKRHDDQTEDWMKQIRDVAYDIEDCIDDFAHSLHPDPRGSGWLTAVRKTLYEIRTWCSRRKIAAQIIDLKNRAEQIGKRRVRYGVRDPQPREGNGLADLTEHHAADHQHITRQLVRVKQPVGTDMPELESWLVDKKRSELGVLSVVGFGGVGKTTIATALFRKLEPQFERRAMVTVSQNSDPEIVWGNILNQLKLQADNNGVQETGKDGASATLEKKVPVIGSILSRLRLPWRNEEDDDDSTVQEKHKSGNTLSQLKNNGEQQDGTRSLLSRLRLLCGKEGEDGVHQKHRQIQAELRNYLGQKRYCSSSSALSFSRNWICLMFYMSTA